MLFDPREAVAAKARHMLTHPWDVGMWSAWWGASLQNVASDPAGFWRAAIQAQVDSAEAYLQWWEGSCAPTVTRLTK